MDVIYPSEDIYLPLLISATIYGQRDLNLYTSLKSKLNPIIAIVKITFLYEFLLNQNIQMAAYSDSSLRTESLCQNGRRDFKSRY